MGVHVIDHPLVQHKLGLMRQADISTKDFRDLCVEMGRLLTYEATKDLETEAATVMGWAGEVRIRQIRGKKVTVVPILRAGLGMMPGILDMLPGARTSVVGLYRDEVTLEPFVYYKKMAREMSERIAIVLDPMLATGGSLCAAIDMLKETGCLSIRCLHLVAAPEGIELVSAKHPDVDIYVASIDDGLNENGYILPGLGDAGDKIFGTK